MALAVLCKEIQDQQLQFKAFVVDHKARPQSTVEAEAVADRLEKLGTSTQMSPTRRHWEAHGYLKGLIPTFVPSRGLLPPRHAKRITSSPKHVLYVSENLGEHALSHARRDFCWRTMRMTRQRRSS